MAVPFTTAQQYVAETFVPEMQSFVQSVESWLANKNDSDPSFDYTTALADLKSAAGSFASSVETVTAL